MLTSHCPCSFIYLRSDSDPSSCYLPRCDPAIVGHDTTPLPTAGASGDALCGRYALVEPISSPLPRAAVSLFAGSLISSVGVEPAECQSGVRDSGSGGSGGSSNSSSDGGGGRDRGGGGVKHGNRYEWSSLASPCIDSPPSSFREVEEGHSGVPDGGSGGSCSVRGHTDRSESISGRDRGSRDSRYHWAGDSPHSRPRMHRHHNPVTVDASHTAMYLPSAVALSTPRRAFACTPSTYSINEAQEMEGEVVEGEGEEQGEEEFVSSMLLESREVEGDMRFPEGWMRYPLATDEDGDDATDEMLYRFLVEDHFGML